MCHMSGVRCQVSGVRGHVSCVIFFLFFSDKVVKLVGAVEGLLSTGPTPSSFVCVCKFPGLEYALL